MYFAVFAGATALRSSAAAAAADSDGKIHTPSEVFTKTEEISAPTA